MRRLLSPTEYAKHRGVTLEAVRQALKVGRISARRGKIDPKQADQQWSERSHPAGHGGQNRGKRQPRAGKAVPYWGRSGADPADPEAPTFAAMRARREQAQAELAELDLARRRGELAPLGKLREELFAINRRARDMLLALPDRLAPRLTMLDQVEIHVILTEELTRVCHEIADARPL